MIRNPAFLLNVQIAFIGILVVVGMFYLWRCITRIEEKVDHIDKVLASRPPVPPAPMHVVSPMVDMNMNDMLAEEMMKEVFGGAAPIFMTSTNPAPTEGGVHIEEVAPMAAPKEEKLEEKDENQSVAPSTSAGLSKSKVRRMTSDALREVCGQMGLPTEGTRPELMDRILEVLEEDK